MEEMDSSSIPTRGLSITITSTTMLQYAGYVKASKTAANQLQNKVKTIVRQTDNLLSMGVLYMYTQFPFKTILPMKLNLTKLNLTKLNLRRIKQPSL